MLVMASCILVHWLVATDDLGQSIVEDFVTVGVATTAAIVMATSTTTFLSAAVLGIFCPHFDNKRHIKPWLAITSYAAAHFLLMPLAFPLCILVTIWGRGLFGAGFVGITIVLWLACGLLNAFTLHAVVRHRGAKSGPRSWAMFFVYAIYSILPALIQILAIAICFWLRFVLSL